MTLATVRAAAIDRALVGDDPESALALAGVVDSAVRERDDRSEVDGDTSADPFTAAMLAVRCIGAAGAPAPADRALDDRAWRPGRDADPFVVAGAAAAVRERGVAVERAAALADCAPATLEAVVERECQKRRRSG